MKQNKIRKGPNIMCHHRDIKGEKAVIIQLKTKMTIIREEEQEQEKTRG
jgi:hypothetical protein